MTDKEKLEKIKTFADAMYNDAFNMTTDASLLRKAMEKYHQFIIREYYKEEPVSIWHDSNKEQPNYASTVAIWSPKCKNGEIISRCTEVYSDRIWAYIDDLLKM